MTVNRRKILVSGGATLFASLLGSRSADATPLNGAVVRNLPSKDVIWSWEEKLGSWAPCFTGTPGHRAFTQFLAEQLQVAGIEPQRKDFGINLWTPKAWTLRLKGYGTVPVSCYRPYSGPTGPAGVIAEMAYVGKVGGTLDWSDVKGKIALIDTPAPITHREDGGADLSIPLYTVRLASEEDARKAGAVGIVNIWNNLSDDDARDQALPFAGPPVETPSLWVGEKAGQVLKAAAKIGSRLTLTLYATRDPEAKGENVWGVLPGVTDDVVIVNTHNDGCNAIEENGGLAVVALAQAMARIPAGQRQKTYVFFTSSGHFAHGYHRGSVDWTSSYPDYIKRAIACLTVEHLGGMEWTDNAQGEYRPTGRVQASSCYVPTVPVQSIWNAARSPASSANRMITQTSSFYFPGEGSQFSALGVPCIAYISAPDYLMTAPEGGEVLRLNKDAMYEEIESFARCLEQLDATTRELMYAGMEARPLAPVRPPVAPPIPPASLKSIADDVPALTSQ